jgi:hypothetical protein
VRKDQKRAWTSHSALLKSSDRTQGCS